jgi:hypothetical protein
VVPTHNPTQPECNDPDAQQLTTRSEGPSDSDIASKMNANADEIRSAPSQLHVQAAHPSRVEAGSMQTEAIPYLLVISFAVRGKGADIEFFRIVVPRLRRREERARRAVLSPIEMATALGLNDQESVSSSDLRTAARACSGSSSSRSDHWVRTKTVRRGVRKQRMTQELVISRLRNSTS